MLFIGILKLGILNASYTIPLDKKSPLNQLQISQGSDNRAIFSRDYVELIKSCLQLNFTKRPTARFIRDRCEKLLQSFE